MTNESQWFSFSAPNAETLYGYGTGNEALKYVARLNSDREVNLYEINDYPAQSVVADLESGTRTDAYDLADLLADTTEAE